MYISSWYHPLAFRDAFFQSSEREQMSGRVLTGVGVTIHLCYKNILQLIYC